MLSALNNWANSLARMGKLNEAEPLRREVLHADLTNRPDHPSTLISMGNFASLLGDLGRREEAADWAQRSMEAHLRVLKFKHPTTRDAIGTAIYYCMILSREEEALRITDRMLELARRELEPDDSRTLELMRIRFVLRRRLGDLAGARSLAAECVEVWTRKLGPEGPQTLTALADLAVLRRDQGESAEARMLLRRLHEDARRAVKSAQTKPLDAELALRLGWQVALAEVAGRNLGRPERSDAAPGTPGGPPRLDAAFRTVPPVADGRVEPGEYGDGNGFAFDFVDDHNPGRMYLFEENAPATKDPADLSVRMHAAHTASALFFAFQVRDQYVRADPLVARAPWKNDSVELFLDGDRMPNDFMAESNFGNLEGFQIVADVLGNRFSGAPAVGERRWKVGTARTTEGYVIEFEIPLDLIDTQDGPGFRPAATGSDLRMNVAINDVDEAINKQTHEGMLWAEDRRLSPYWGAEDLWPVALRLVPAPKPDR
jgi:hypothetical protein